MSNAYYTPSGTPATGAQGSSSDVRSEFALIETALDKLPTLTADFVVVVNGTGTALVPVASLTVAQGGTGVTTLTDGGILLGSGTGAITALAVLADGEMVVGDGTTDPAIESGATLRTSIGVGTGNTPTFAGLVLTAALPLTQGGTGGTSAATARTNIQLSSSDTVTFSTVHAAGTTDSTSTTTGSLHTHGGLGVVKNFYVNGNLVHTDSFDVNTKLGVDAGTNLGSGGDSVAIGNEALKVGTSIANTVIGHQAALILAGGNSNTIIGAFAMDTATSANSSTCIGKEAGDQITTGNSNICIGVRSGSNCTDDDFSILIGNTSGVVGASNIQYGYVLGHSQQATESHQIVIGSPNGNIKNEFDTDNAWTQSSDKRKKTNIHTATMGLEFINLLRPVTYNLRPASEWPKEWDIDPEIKIDTKRVMHSFIAQEVKAALDACGIDSDTFAGWGEDKQGQRISKEMFVFPLIKAVQELTARLEALETAHA